MKIKFCKPEKITLNCGYPAETWLGKGDKGTIIKHIEILLTDLYNGYGNLNNPLLLSKLFLELSEKGYSLNGIFVVHGYYDSIDDLKLNGTKECTREEKLKILQDLN